MDREMSTRLWRFLLGMGPILKAYVVLSVQQTRRLPGETQRRTAVYAVVHEDSSSGFDAARACL